MVAIRPSDHRANHIRHEGGILAIDRDSVTGSMFPD